MAQAADITDGQTLVYRLSGRRLVRTQGERGSIWSIDQWIVTKKLAEEMVKTDQLTAADPGLLGDAIPQSYVLRDHARSVL
jgi:hypothetical protein